MFFRRSPEPQGTVGEFLSDETAEDLRLVAIINGGETKVYASQPAIKISSYEVVFEGGPIVRAKGNNQEISGGKGGVSVLAIGQYRSSSLG